MSSNSNKTDNDKQLMNDLILQMLTENPFTPLTDSSSSSSSSEENSSEVDEHPRRKRVKISNYVESVAVNYSNEEFKIHFRMTRATAYEIVGLLENSNLLPSHSWGREKISSERAFLLSLWYLSNMETFRQIADRFDTTYSCAHYCLRRVLKFLLSIKSQIIKWPTEERIVEINEGFRKRQGIENIVGAIDGSHIEINLPQGDPQSYINRKGYPSLVLQGVVDHEKKIIDVFCGEPSSIHDARLLRKSALYERNVQNVNVMRQNFLVGDSAYPNLHWLVTPFRDNGRLTREQKTFNYRMSATRVIIENALGLLKGRFRRLRKLDNLDLMLCAEIILAACILHNLCLNENDIVDTSSEDFNQPQPVAVNTVNSNIVENTSRQQQVFTEMINL